MDKRTEFISESLSEGGLIFAVAAIGWATHQPLVFASLGATAYEQVDKPHSKSSTPYNVIAGHLVGLASGFFAVFLLHAWNAPDVMTAGFVPLARLGAAVLAVVLTTAGTLLLNARQPAATATALLVALGSMQTRRDSISIIAAVLLITLIGEPLRRVHKAHKQPE